MDIKSLEILLNQKWLSVVLPHVPGRLLFPLLLPTIEIALLLCLCPPSQSFNQLHLLHWAEKPCVPWGVQLTFFLLRCAIDAIDVVNTMWCYVMPCHAVNAMQCHDAMWCYVLIPNYCLLNAVLIIGSTSCWILLARDDGTMVRWNDGTIEQSNDQTSKEHWNDQLIDQYCLTEQRCCESREQQATVLSVDRTSLLPAIMIALLLYCFHVNNLISLVAVVPCLCTFI